MRKRVDEFVGISAGRSTFSDLLSTSRDLLMETGLTHWWGQEREAAGAENPSRLSALYSTLDPLTPLAQPPGKA